MDDYIKELVDSSLTVQELIDTLSKYEKGIKVMFTWEGQLIPVKKDCAELHNRSNGAILTLDADDH